MARRFAAMLLAGLTIGAGLLGCKTQDQPTSVATPSGAASTSSSVSPAGPGSTDATETVDPESGLQWVSVDALPAEARDTIELIDAGGPFPYPPDDGKTFSNFEGLLPDHGRGYYREYTVPTPGSDDRGARRIVVGDAGEFYWTNDHYATFNRIERTEQ